MLLQSMAMHLAYYLIPFMHIATIITRTVAWFRETCDWLRKLGMSTNSLKRKGGCMLCFDEGISYKY